MCLVMCYRCGAIIANDSKYCPRCAAPGEQVGAFHLGKRFSRLAGAAYFLVMAGAREVSIAVAFLGLGVFVCVGFLCGMSVHERRCRRLARSLRHQTDNADSSSAKGSGPETTAPAALFR